MIKPNFFINGRFLTHRISGVERYAREIVNALDEIVLPNQVELVCPPETKDVPKLKNIRVCRVGRLHNRLWEHVSFPLYVRKKKGVSLNLCNVAPLIDPGVVCIHDMMIKTVPYSFNKSFLLWYRLLFGNAVRRAKFIVTVSDFSKAEIIKYYRISPVKIVVAPNGWQHLNALCFDENALRKYDLERGNFFFSLGSIKPVKNIKWIAEMAFNHPGETFAVAGAINKVVFANGIGFECPPNLKLLGFVSDEEAKSLMRDCKAFLFPSFYEGFGIPPLEALSVGAKIIVSDIPVMHEIFGDVAAYLDPHDSSIPVIPAKQETDEAARTVLEKYSWEIAAKRIYDGLQGLT